MGIKGDVSVFQKKKKQKYTNKNATSRELINHINYENKPKVVQLYTRG